MFNKYSILTLDPEVDSLADGGRHTVTGDTEVRGHVGAGDAVKHEGGPAHTRHCTMGKFIEMEKSSFIDCMTKYDGVLEKEIVGR